MAWLLAVVDLSGNYQERRGWELLYSAGIPPLLRPGVHVGGGNVLGKGAKLPARRY